MASEKNSKTFKLSTSWKNHIVGYVLSVLLIPLFGVGLFILYWVYKRHTRYTYTVSDTQITVQDDKYHRTIDLVDIREVDVSQNWLQSKLDAGDVVLHTSALEVELLGMENPVQLKNIIEKAVAAEHSRVKTTEKTDQREPEHDPGSMDKMDYLTGLWQQGLMSDEDFKKERKHFE